MQRQRVARYRGGFVLEYYDSDGRHRRALNARDVAAAHAEAGDLIRAIERGRMGRLTVAGAVQHYLNKTKAIGKPIMEFHARHITAALGEVPAEAVDQDAVDRYIKGRSAAPGTVRKELGILRAALRFCAKAKVMGAAPQTGP